MRDFFITHKAARQKCTCQKPLSLVLLDRRNAPLMRLRELLGRRRAAANIKVWRRHWRRRCRRVGATGARLLELSGAQLGLDCASCALGACAPPRVDISHRLPSSASSSKSSLRTWRGVFVAQFAKPQQQQATSLGDAKQANCLCLQSPRRLAERVAAVQNLHLHLRPTQSKQHTGAGQQRRPRRKSAAHLQPAPPFHYYFILLVCCLSAPIVEFLALGLFASEAQTGNKHD